MLSLVMALIECCPSAWHMLIERFNLRIKKWCTGEYIDIFAELKEKVNPS